MSFLHSAIALPCQNSCTPASEHWLLSLVASSVAGREQKGNAPCLSLPDAEHSASKETAWGLFRAGPGCSRCIAGGAACFCVLNMCRD